ncbi:MAG: hypothetical protein HY682_07930 [Chloroflexi bacterium]|nr:hypothetical protein [Chloroflexota bacterium]
MNEAMDRSATPPTAALQPVPIPVPAGFPVVWENEEEPTLLWTWDEFHAPLPRSPMTGSVAEIGRQGMARATRETGGYAPAGLRKIINGYPYSASRPNGPSSGEQARRRELIDRAMAEARHRWDNEWQPGLERDLAVMKAVNLSALTDLELLETIDRFLELHGHHWYVHHLVVVPAIEAAERLEKRYAEIVGGEARQVAHRLLHGADTKTAQSIRALDSLALEAARWPLIREAITAASDLAALTGKVGATEEGGAWLGSLHEYIDEYGYRCAGFDLIYPTWVEDPSFVIQNVRARATAGGSRESWTQQNTRLAEQRDRMVAEVRSKLAGQPNALQDFDRLFRSAQELWPLKEDHSHYIDQASTAFVRMALAEAGRRLRRRGVLDAADDIWFVTLDEARSALGASTVVLSPRDADEGPVGRAEQILPRLSRDQDDRLHALVQQRQADRARWSKLRPPKHLGTYPADYDGKREPPPDAIGDGTGGLRGTAASPGEATGPAVVVMSPDDFGKVRPGSILVCRSTAPMWTPLFQVAAGLVSEAGGVLSHPAVVAREFGLPAVVGVRGATSIIRDGQPLTVSGSTGLVTIL